MMPSSKRCCLRSAWRQLEGRLWNPQWGCPWVWERVLMGANPGIIAGEVLLPEGRGWGSSGQGSQPAGPSQIEEDVGCVISALAARLWMGTPRINTFSGNATLGKTEVSFEQWYHDVQCIKDCYLESVVWESIVRSLKGAVADVAWYMSPTTSVTHILQKLAIIFGTLVSFNIQVQNFYKVTKGNHEKVPSFTTRRLEPQPN